ncbi:hypothetical protein Pan110_36870 [Gimesia panareensis]|nr:hypothetical protein Pan110_36870 [Gimesia panareensis]
MTLKIGDASGLSSLLSPNQDKRNQDHAVQNIFSAMLAQVGRQGYVSAETTDAEPPTVESLQRSWDSWFNSERTGRYSQVEKPDELKQSFGNIIVRAHNEGGYVDPKSFLKKLSREELEVVQKVQGLADPIDVDGLSEEGALNLLLPGAAQVDLNQDGFTRTGAAYGLRFPNSNTPAEVVAAWDEATKDMDFGQLATAQMQMMLPLLTANIEVDENGQFVRQYEPGDPEFKNPFANADFSYTSAVKNQLDSLEAQKNELPADKYESQKSFWSKLQQSLQRYGAN